jgi:hypothetical protein
MPRIDIKPCKNLSLHVRDGNVEALPYKQEAGLVGQTELYDLVVAPESEVRGNSEIQLSGEC